MANYLPVLLVSVSTNSALTVPDDSSLTTQPRAQVDYLSHEWQEEDVWRSWRNMTRQKNEITNGARLENASWRTWWKQRNKLKTISPETLNWLKDSDVTWLYGPLHTAVEWTPPPKPKPVPDSVDHDPASAEDRLDLSSGRPRRPPPTKPILKHRSISELLTSDFPPSSPIFSPVESEDDEETGVNTAGTSIPSDPNNFLVRSKHKRPPLAHTKSDSHVTRYPGTGRAFRKDSPPRIDPPGFDGQAETNASSSSSHLASSGSSSQHLPAGVIGPIRQSHSQDSNSSGTGVGERTSHGGAQKKKHISFNTFVEQCIAIEKPKKNASGFFGAVEESTWMGGGKTAWVDEDGYEEDQEVSEEEDLFVHGSEWPRGATEMGARAIRSDSEGEEEEELEEEDEDDGVIEIRSSSSRSTTKPAPQTKKRPPPRSQSKVSTTSSSSSASTSTTTSSTSSNASNGTHSSTHTTNSPSGSISPSRRSNSTSQLNNRKTPISAPTLSRRSSTSTYRPSAYRRGPRPPLIRTPSDSNYPHTLSHHHHVTIAPIAPTMLKTNGVGTSGPASGGWAEGFGDEGGGGSSDDGFIGWAWGVGGVEKSGSGKEGSKKGGGNNGGANGYFHHSPHPTHNSSNGYGLPFTASPGTIDTGATVGSFGTGRGANATRAMGFGPPTPAGGYGYGGAPGLDDMQGSSDGTPVELVYVPPLGSNYSLGLGEYEYDDEGLDGLSEQDEQEEVEAAVEQLEDTYLEQHHPSTSAPINIASLREPSSSSTTMAYGAVPKSVPKVVLDPKYGQRRDVQEEDAYDFFEGPDLGVGEDYYYARRGGRGYEYSSATTSAQRTAAASAQLSAEASLNPPPVPTHTSSSSSRQRERERERRQVGNGDERPSRSRSRSQSRTPSPSFTSVLHGAATAGKEVPISAAGGSSGTVNGRKRSNSASSPSNNGLLTPGSSSSYGYSRTQSGSDLLSPPPRGRQSDARDARPTVQTQSQSRGRSSTRTSSSSWERSASVGSSTSPIGSLSPDGGRAGAGIGVGVGLGSVLGSASALAGGGRDRGADRGGAEERGRERRGRERTSGKILVGSEMEVNGHGHGPHGRHDRDRMSATPKSPTNVASASTSESSTPMPTPRMDASFSSATSSDSSASASTVRPQVSTFEDEFMHRAEDEERRRRNHPTPSNSPVVEMRMAPVAVSSGISSPRSNAGSSRRRASGNGSGSASGDTTPTQAATSSNTTSPPLSDFASVNLSSKYGVDETRNSTSVTNPPSPHSHSLSSPSPISPSKLRPPPLIPSPASPAKPSTSFTSPPAVSGPISPLAAANGGENGIVGKAVDIVSNAGAYLGLWGSAPSSSSTGA